MALLLGCPAMGDGAVEQQRRKVPLVLLLGCPAVGDGLVEQKRRKGEIEKEKNK